MNTTELYRIIEQKERHINYLEAQNKELIVKNMDLQEQLSIPRVVVSDADIALAAVSENVDLIRRDGFIQGAKWCRQH